MRRIAALLVVTVAALSVSTASGLRPKWNQLDGYTFERFSKDFHKSYATPAERALRRRRFEHSLAEARRHNADKSQTWKQGINHMSDWTAEELKKLRGGRLGEMHELQQELLKKPYVKRHTLRSSPGGLPHAVDYSKAVPAVLTAVKDQGMCGSCWAHAATESIETHWALATGELNVLSQQSINACAPNTQQCGGTGGCGGSIAELAFDWVVGNGGIPEEWQYPYTSWAGVTGTCQLAGTANFAKLSGYVKVDTNDQFAVMDALATVGPLAVNVDASTWNTYESGVFSGCNYAKNISIDHVVQLVGYGHDDSLGLDFWLVRNSWTPTYGEAGFIRVLRQSNPACGWNVNPQDGTGCAGGPPQQWTCGMCGILFDTSYPLPNTN